MFKPTVGHRSFDENNDDDDVKVVYLPHPQMELPRLQCSNIETCTQTHLNFSWSEDRLIWSWDTGDSSVIDMWFFGEADSDTDHYQVVKKRCREQMEQRIRCDMEEFDWK